MPRGGTRQGAGRKTGSTKAEGMPTKVVRVSIELDNEKYQRLPELLSLIDHWESELLAARQRGESTRTYEKLEKLLTDIRSIGY